MMNSLKLTSCLLEAYPLCLQQLLEHEQEIPYLHVFTFALDCGFVLDAISGFYAPSFLYISTIFDRATSSMFVANPNHMTSRFWVI